MWKNITSVLERTGEAITKAVPQGLVDDDEPPLAQRLQQGWGSVVQSTKHALDATREAVEKEQSRLFSSPVKRDPRLPLDIDALRDAEVVYITERIITMGAIPPRSRHSMTELRPIASWLQSHTC
jgi:hypothetical protein